MLVALPGLPEKERPVSRAISAVLRPLPMPPTTGQPEVVATAAETATPALMPPPVRKAPASQPRPLQPAPWSVARNRETGVPPLSQPSPSRSPATLVQERATRVEIACAAPYRAPDLVSGMDYAAALKVLPGPVRLERRFTPPYHRDEPYLVIELSLPARAGPYAAVFFSGTLMLHGAFDAASAQLQIEQTYLAALVSARVLSASGAATLGLQRMEALWGSALPHSHRSYQQARIEALQRYERREISVDEFRAALESLEVSRGTADSACAG